MFNYSREYKVYTCSTCNQITLHCYTPTDVLIAQLHVMATIYSCLSCMWYWGNPGIRLVQWSHIQRLLHPEIWWGVKIWWISSQLVLILNYWPSLLILYLAMNLFVPFWDRWSQMTLIFVLEVCCRAARACAKDFMRYYYPSRWACPTYSHDL